MSKLYANFFLISLSFFSLPAFSFGQNISINTSGAANSTSSMLEVLGTSTASGGSGLYVSQGAAVTNAIYGFKLFNTSTSGTASINKFGLDIQSTGVWNGATANNYGLQVNAAGGTNNYAIVVPSGGGNVGIGTTSPCSLAKLEVVGDNQISGVRPAANTAYAAFGTFSDNWCAALSGTTLAQYGTAAAASGSVMTGIADAGIGALDFYNLTTYGIITTSNAIPILFGTNKLERMRIAAAGQVGINMTPAMQLDVTSSSTTASDAAIRGASTGNALVYGVKGSVTSTTNFAAGVFGLASGTSGITNGVLGQTYSTAANAAGTRGYAGAASGATFGVWGENFSSSANATGVYGIATSASGSTNGVWGEVNSTTTDAAGVYGTSSGNGQGYGVFGLTGSSVTTTAASGVLGKANAATGSVYGVTGITMSSTGIGVIGDAKETTGANYGVYGISRSTSGIGVYGQASTASGFTFGVYGINASTSSGTGWGGANTKAAGVFGDGGTGASSYQAGVYGHLIGTGTNSGGVVGAYSGTVWGGLGYNSGGGVQYAGYFNGNAYITGNLTVVGSVSKGSGSFLIDHPLDPLNKFLYHSFVESPDMMNIYNGNVFTDTNGEAEVKLPDYFQTLNIDYRYQLTVIGQFAQAIVLEKIKDNKFKIKTDKPNVEVSWQVTGVRNDPFAQKHRIIPEVDKNSVEKGKYLHPDVYGYGQDNKEDKKEDAAKEQKNLNNPPQTASPNKPE